MQKHSKSSLFSIFVSRSSTVLSRISIWSIEAPIKRTRGAQRESQKVTEKVPFLFWGGLQDMFSIVGGFAGQKVLEPTGPVGCPMEDSAHGLGLQAWMLQASRLTPSRPSPLNIILLTPYIPSNCSFIDLCSSIIDLCCEFFVFYCYSTGVYRSFIDYHCNFIDA